MILTDAFVLINGVDLSDFVTSVSLPYGAEMQDGTAMGDTTRRNEGGLKTWSIDLEMKQNFSAGAVNATLFPLVGNNVPIEIRATSAGRSATNPAWVATGIIDGYSPIDNAVGELMIAPVTIQSVTALTMATS